MARLIVKSPYIKCGGRRSAGGYMRYIATRERVELIQDDRPPTRKQEQLIVKLVKEFPDARKLDEYADYQEHPNKANIFQDNSLPQSGTGLTHIDHKRHQELKEKRLAHGHKENDHEEQQYGGWNMTMR